MASFKSQANPYLTITELETLWLAIYQNKTTTTKACYWNRRTLHVSVQVHWQRPGETFS